METHAARQRGGLLRAPSMGVVWAILAVLVVLFAAHEDIGLGGGNVDYAFDHWVNVALLWAAAAACLGGALSERRGRVAWLLVATALACWAAGDTIWAIRFGHDPRPPLTSFSDVLWLAWYPLLIGALALLVRDRVPRFELHRWIDGVAVMLIISTPLVALILQPIAEQSSATELADAVAFAYPLGDAIIIGATLGVFALMGWRPGRMWLFLGLGLVAIGLADAINAVQGLRDYNTQGGYYDAAWAGGAALIAYAAWQPHPGRLEPRQVWGWSVIALPLAAQVIAASIQIYGYFHEIPKSERVLTLLVLMIAMVQIVVTRPRRPSASSDPPDGS